MDENNDRTRVAHSGSLLAERLDEALSFRGLTDWIGGATMFDAMVGRNQKRIWFKSNHIHSL